MRFRDISGQRFGLLTAITPTDELTSHGKTWICQCDCGRQARAGSCSLRSGNTRSCGCLSIALRIGNRYRQTHGKTQTPEWKVWNSMHLRCRHSKNYKGRISVCQRWGKFEAFLEDMGARPSPKHTLERKNNDGHYSPDNCCWALMRDQQRNRRNNHRITHEGMTLTLIEWADRTGINLNTLGNRLKAGWSHSKALTTPSRPKRPNHFAA